MFMLSNLPLRGYTQERTQISCGGRGCGIYWLIFFLGGGVKQICFYLCMLDYINMKKKTNQYWRNFLDFFLDFCASLFFLGRGFCTQKSCREERRSLLVTPPPNPPHTNASGYNPQFINSILPVLLLSFHKVRSPTGKRKCKLNKRSACLGSPANPFFNY